MTTAIHARMSTDRQSDTWRGEHTANDQDDVIAQ